MTAKLVEFWFDFSSPYSYFASSEIDAVAARHGRTVRWQPFMLGTAFRITGASPLTDTPLKAEYAARDWRRIAASRGLPYNPPASHPAVALPATRAFYYLERRSHDEAKVFAKAVFAAYYEGKLDTADAQAVTALAGDLGHDCEAVAKGMTDPVIKERAKTQSETAVARGVFGVPWFFIDEEPFWGWDRLPMVERWLATGKASLSEPFS